MGRPLKYPSDQVFSKIETLVSGETRAQERRRTDKSETLFGVTDLQAELGKEGFEYSRSATYNFLSPRRKSSKEAGRHHTGASVHFYRPENNLESGHAHSHYANAQAKNLHQLQEILVDRQPVTNSSGENITKWITYLSYDNKAKVPLGVPATKPVKVIGMEGSEVRLPNHEWTVANKHSLVISVCVLQGTLTNKQGYVTYTPGSEKYYDNCFLVVGSSLHTPPSPVEHHYNFQHIFDNFEELKMATCTPIVVLQSDGGTDVNSRNSMDRMCLGNLAWKEHVELLAHFTRAPGDSPLNPVERTFAPLTRAMANQIYSHDFFGNHLNSRRQIVDKDLCKRNFVFQANRCAVHLRKANIHGKHPAVYVRLEPAVLQFFGGAFNNTEYNLFLHQPTKLDDDKKKIIQKWETWLLKHSQSSWYCYQIRLCDCELCPPNRKFQGVLEACLPDLSNHKSFVPTPQKDSDSDHFLPLEELLARPYCRPDFFLPENPAAKIKPVLCPACDVVCTSQKDFFKHQKAQHYQLGNIAPLTTTTTTTTTTSSTTTTTTSTDTTQKLSKRSSLKRSRSSKKSPPESSPKKKACFSKRLIEGEGGEEVLHNDEEGDDDDVDYERITADELDFFAGSTTFGRQVREIAGLKRTEKKLKRRSR